ncbi:glycosyltransferase family 2 protein [Pseudovibrio axinellae]|uniref:glycosyltransferase family 2 protein n=1 Tax=Pseudovibrio axinellae TaxID=989403 RepID=UPI0009428A64|nr:glycosyltransferase family 2 protein [Pseudovibrio axinellae]
MKPLISYLLTVFNKEVELPETLACLRNQSGLEGAHIEFVFADDCSTDQSVEYLKAQSRSDPRIKIITNQTNCGPSVRINQAAEHANGSYFLPMDADDFLPLNGTRMLLDVSGDKGAPVVFGGSQRGFVPDGQIDQNVMVTVSHDPLAYCARKKIVHMGFLSDAALWNRVGGADERIFIQDQSLALRLSAEASRLAYIHDTTYWLRPRDGNNLSNNTDQQHHDRFLSALYQLENTDISLEAKQYLVNQVISARWKLVRDRGKFGSLLTEQFLSYVTNRLLPHMSIPKSKLKKYEYQMLHIKGVRRTPQSLHHGMIN